MSRKDYELIARAMLAARPQSADPTIPRSEMPEFRAWERCVNELCHALSRDNPRFHRNTFYTACGLGTP